MIYNLFGFSAGLVMLTLLTVLGFWKEIWAPLFMLAAGVSMVLGLNTPRLLSSPGTASDIAITVGLALIIYSFLMFAMSFKVATWESGDDE